MIFGGTVEGRQWAERLGASGSEVVVSVTSEYARRLLPPATSCHVGVLDRSEMGRYIAALSPERVIDATHPYAVRATENIKACCGALGIPYERVERPVSEGAWRQDVEHVADAAAAAQSLMRTEGNVLLTTGSKTIQTYTRAVDSSRLWARVLPTVQAITLCDNAGLPSSHIIAMQGPFTAALNAALYDQLAVRTVVTKDSGLSGGVEEKVIPALERDIHVIMIDRPKEGQ
ncbi:MAG: precorrin-6A reductase [Clostridia bacterium]|nr:precorrin-6A reductase [Clostridia bacterium]